MKARRIRACSRAASKCWYSPKFPAPKKSIDCVSASGFSAASCLVLLFSQTSVSPHSQEAQTPYHWLCLLAFHCNNHHFTSLPNPARGITARLCARKGAIRRPLSAQAVVEIRSVQYPGYCRKSSVVPRGYCQNVWRDQFLRRAQG